MPRLRVAAYNVHGFRAGTKRVAAALAEERPDVLLLNETGYVGWSLAWFERRTGMRAVSGLQGFRRIPNSVLVRPPWRVLSSTVVRFPRHARTVRRGAVIADVFRAGVHLVTAAVHLGLSSDERRAHSELLTDLVAARAPAVIGGDFNEDPLGPAVTWVRERFWDAFDGSAAGDALTFPSQDPRARIDYLFVSEGVMVERAWVGTSAGGASDHLPVIADIVVGE